MKLSGVMPSIATPFQNGKLAPPKLKSNFQKWNKTGLSGYLALGSNGGAVYLNEAVTTKYGIGSLKMAMDLAGYFGGDPRAPLKRPDKNIEEELKRHLVRLKG